MPHSVSGKRFSHQQHHVHTFHNVDIGKTCHFLCLGQRDLTVPLLLSFSGCTAIQTLQEQQKHSTHSAALVLNIYTQRCLSFKTTTTQHWKFSQGTIYKQSFLTLWPWTLLTLSKGIVDPPRHSTVKSTMMSVVVTMTYRCSFSPKSKCRLSANAMAPRKPEKRPQILILNCREKMFRIYAGHMNCGASPTTKPHHKLHFPGDFVLTKVVGQEGKWENVDSAAN